MNTENHGEYNVSPPSFDEKGGKPASKAAVYLSSAIVIALIAFGSAYLGAKLASVPANAQVATPGSSSQILSSTPTAVGNPTNTPAASLTNETAELKPTTNMPTASPSPTANPVISKYPDNEVVVFADKQVEDVIRQTLNKPEGNITAGDMKWITSFNYDPVNDKNATGTITTLADLRYCVSLETLHVLHQPVDSLEGLQELNKLSDICILGCSVSDLSPLAGKESLSKVWISGNPVKDAAPVLSLPNLTEFNAYFGTGIKDISALSTSGKLRYFFCQNTLKDYTPLLRQKNLQGVTLSGVTDAFFRELLSNCKVLRSICLDHSSVKDESLSLLKGRTMYNLYFESCGLKDISALADLGGVTDLRLGNNQIEDISALKELDVSYVVDLRNNRIKDLSPLEHMTRLENLYVTGNLFTDDSVLNKLASGGCSVYR